MGTRCGTRCTCLLLTEPDVLVLAVGHWHVSELTLWGILLQRDQHIS